MGSVLAPARRRRPTSGRTLQPAIWALALGALLAICAATPPASAAPDSAEIRRQMERIVARERFQTELPDNDPPPPPPKPSSSDFELEPIAEIALYALLAAAAIFVIYTMMQKKIASTPRGAVGKRAVASGAARATDNPDAAELADAEAAALAEAEAGRFEEAIHLLLLGAIGRLRERDARAAARSLTSREILARASSGRLSPAVGAALRDLVTAVEVSRFGGRPMDRAAFDRCLQAYREMRRAVSEASSASGAPRVSPDLSPA